MKAASLPQYMQRQFQELQKMRQFYEKGPKFSFFHYKMIGAEYVYMLVYVLWLFCPNFSQKS